MHFFLIGLMTTLAVGWVTWLIATSQHTNLYSLRNLFMVVWLYYGFAIGIDLMTGAELPYTVGEPDMAHPSNCAAVTFVMWNYILCGIAFMVTYTLFQGRSPSCPIDVRYDLKTPSRLVLAVIHGLVSLAFVQIFFGMERVERLARAQEVTEYKLAFLIIPVLIALDVIVILSAETAKARVAWLLAVMASLMTGNRSYVLICFLVAAFRWRPKLHGWKLVGLVVTCTVVLFTFKTSYSVGQAWWMGERVSLSVVMDHLQYSLSGLDATASYLIAIFYTKSPSPWWLGSSYVETPLLLSWPRFLGESHVETLAEHYVVTYHPEMAIRGGAMAFSAIAEAWLNFSYLGAILVGAVFGALTQYFDARPRGIPFFIAMLIVVRAFRSDAATLFKNWVLVWGFIFLAVFVAMTIYTALRSPKRQPHSLRPRNSIPPMSSPPMSSPPLRGAIR